MTLVYASVDKDENVAEDTETFRIDRRIMKHLLAFVRGLRMCVDAALAPETGLLAVPIRFALAA